MGNAESRVTSVARAITAITAKVFRCPGLERVAPDADRLGAHDIAYWLVFVAVIAGWFLFLYAPERERLSMLEGRHQTLTGHLAAERRELARLQRSIKDLTRGDPQAWERAARGRLGWVEPGEITDLKNGIPKPPPKPGSDSHQTTNAPPPQAPVLPRPAAPPL
ncbi:MAG: hypothetical protein NTW87_01585, partial [Planctomycetota bacterium]|nr:hypothetical protein [Planctomycetota bacterium]